MAVQDKLKNVQHIQASDRAFAAVLDNGSVVTWGDPVCGGFCGAAVQAQLKNVKPRDSLLQPFLTTARS